MLKLRNYLFFALIFMGLSACQPASSQVADLPTLVDFPTATETYTPSPTIPTDTPTATLTFTATFTPSQIPATNTPSRTPTATATRTPIATATASQTFTPANTDTPTASPTAIPTRTPDLPTIETFQSNAVNVNTGAPIILRWSANAETLVLETISNGVVTQTQNVAMVGTYSTNAPSTGGQIIFRLIASRASNEVRSTVTIQVGQACPTNWFFTNPPVGTGCPIAPPQSSPVLYQQFQTGFMFRVFLNGDNRVCGVQTNLNVYSCYQGQTYTGTPPATPPTGYQTPAPELQHTFYTTLATGGFWYDQIGWGTTIGASSNAQMQVSDTGRIYIQLPNGVYGFDSSLSSFGAPFQRVP